MGHEHIDFSMRCCRAGFNDRVNFFDAHRSNEYIKMVGRNDGYISSLRNSEAEKTNISYEETKKRWGVIFNESRIKI